MRDGRVSPEPSSRSAVRLLTREQVLAAADEPRTVEQRRREDAEDACRLAQVIESALNARALMSSVQKSHEQLVDAAASATMHVNKAVQATLQMEKSARPARQAAHAALTQARLVEKIMRRRLVRRMPARRDRLGPARRPVRSGRARRQRLSTGRVRARSPGRRSSDDPSPRPRCDVAAVPGVLAA